MSILAVLRVVFALVICSYGSWICWMLGAGKITFNYHPTLSKLAIKLPFLTNKYVCYGLAVFYILFAINSIYVNLLK